MHSIRHSTKKALYDKGEDEALTPEEQAEVDEVMAWIQPTKVAIDPDEPTLGVALQLYNYVIKEHTTTWEQARRMIMREPVKLWKKLLAIAASIVLIVGSYIWSQNQSNEPGKIIAETSPGNVRVITLPDGSTVWLNKGSTITYPATFAGNERRIELSGEAYFIVNHDATKPFRVMAGNTEIIDEGTEFNVSGYASANAVITTVKTGKVKIKRAGREKEIDPGQQVIAKANSLQVLLSINIDSTLQWKTLFITLEGKTTEAVMEQIHAYYNVPYSIEPGLPPLDLSSEISVENSLESTIKTLDDAAENISFKYRGGKVMVTRK